MKEVRVVSFDQLEATRIVDGEMSTRLITNLREGSDRFSVALVNFEAGVIKEEGEDDRDNAGYVIEGYLTLSWDRGEAKLGPGSAFYIPMGKRVKLYIKNRTKILAIVSPPRI